MHAPSILGKEVDLLGQQPGLYKLYTQLVFCFALSADIPQANVIDTLNAGLERLSSSCPWVPAQVLREEVSNGRPTSYMVKPLDKLPHFTVKDLRKDASAPTMDSLSKANFPFMLLDEAVICPRNTLSQDGPDPAQIFMVQANFVIGGLLLTVQGQHNLMDMTGLYETCRLLSKACRAENFTIEELSIGNLDRGKTICLLDGDFDLEHQTAKQPPEQAAAEGLETSTPPSCSWAYINFSQTSLAALKSLANKSLRTGFVSTDDVLSAIIWKSVMRARLRRLPNAEIKATFARAVDARSFLGIPPSYPGVCNNMVYSTYSIGKLLEKPLGHVASELRLGLDPQKSQLGYKTQALATALSRSNDRSNISVTAALDLSVDLMVSSWAKYDCYNLDFGLGLGNPVRVCRPRFTPVESLIYFMPRTPDGEIAVAVCLRDDDMARLREDEEFAKYGVYVG